MDKLTMAHEYAMKCIGNPNVSAKTNNEIIAFAWSYADAMQDEADKRKPKPELPSLQQTFIDGVEQPRYAPPCEEWQPDWSQAPDGYDWWVIDKCGDSYFYTYNPYISNGSDIWADAGYTFADGNSMQADSSFNYQGNWQESLRKRPQ